MKIAIIVDNPLRDLYACALLAAELSVKNEVYLISFSNAGTEIFQIWPDLVLLNQLRETNKLLVDKLIKSGISYSVLDTEGGLFMDIPGTTENTYTITLPKNPLFRNRLSQYFLWGTDIHAVLLKRKLFLPEKLFCLGTPRMDFFSPPLTTILSADDTKPNRPMILINTSFAGNNPRYSNRTDEMKMLVKKFAYSDEFIREFFDNLDKAHFAYIELTSYLAQQFPEVDFVVRPHPFESETVYKTRLAEHNNVQVILSGTAAEWIIKSKALVHFECSTAIEAGFLNIPVFSLSEFLYVRPLEVVQGISDYAATFAEMKEKISQVLQKEYVVPGRITSNLKSIESRLYYKIDGRSYERIARSIQEQSYPAKTAKSLFYRILYSFYFFFRAILKYLYKRNLIPPGKRIKSEDLSSFLNKLGNADPQLKAQYKKIPFTNIYKIFK